MAVLPAALSACFWVKRDGLCCLDLKARELVLLAATPLGLLAAQGDFHQASLKKTIDICSLLLIIRTVCTSKG